MTGMATIVAFLPSAIPLGMTGAGRFSPYTAAPGGGSVLAVNGKYRAESGPTD